MTREDEKPEWYKFLSEAEYYLRHAVKSISDDSQYRRIHMVILELHAIKQTLLRGNNNE